MSRAVIPGASQVNQGTRRMMCLCLMFLLSMPVFAEDMPWCSFADISTEMDGKVNLGDFTVLAGHWLSACDASNFWCDMADFDRIDGVAFMDLMTLVGCWYAEDTSPPSEDPAQWQVAPQLAPGTVDTVEMVASQVRDEWWPDRTIEYCFDCTDPADGPDRDWSVDRSFMVSGLLPGTYRYAVRARDGSGNETPASDEYEVGVGTDADLPKTEWLQEPYEASPTEIAMQVREYADYSGILELPPGYVIKYEFEEIFAPPAAGGDNRSYLPIAEYTDTVVRDYRFTYRARMGLFYETNMTPEVKLKDGPWSDEISLVLGTYDTIAPTPNPAEFYMTPEVHKVNPRYYQGMAAVIANDTNGVEYRFICSNPAYSSGWRNAANTAGETRPNGATIPGAGQPISGPHEYWAEMSFSNLSLVWRVQYRDASPQYNTGTASDPETVTKMY